MARIEGTQSIPAEWLDEYRGNLTGAMPNNIVRSRYPYRIPLRQDGGYKVTTKQREQRIRWKTIRDKFKNIPWVERQRWYAARPPWASLLWYYNYFMMSGLMGNAVVGDKGGGVIKLIQHIQATIGTAGTTLNFPTAIDPQKAVIMAWGGAHNHDAGYEVSWAWAWAWLCYPVPKILNSSQFAIDWSEIPEAPGIASFSIIEYI